MNGYDGKYQINRYGEVLSIHRHCDRKRKRFDITKRYLAIQTSTYKKTSLKYKFVVLQKDKVRTTYYIHNLVAKAFVPNPENKPSVYHIDGDTTNNSVNNLKWCSKFEFRVITEKQRENGRRMIQQLKQEKKGKIKKAINQYNYNGEFIQQFDSLKEACEVTKINMGHISEAANGKRHFAGNCIWKYAND